MSYHDNGDYYLILDTRESKYWWYDLQDFDCPEYIGNTLQQLLAWWWNKSMELRPEVSYG